MLRDSGDIFLGSQNFTSNAIDNNREMGIILTNRKDIYQKIEKNIVEHCTS